MSVPGKHSLPGETLWGVELSSASELTVSENTLKQSRCLIKK